MRKKWKKAGICVACILFSVLFGCSQKLTVNAMQTEENRKSCTLTLEIPQDSVLREEKQMPDIPVSVYELTDEETAIDAETLKETKAAETPERSFTVTDGKGVITGLASGSYLIVMAPITSDPYRYSFVPYVITLSEETDMVCEVKAGRSTKQEPEQTRPLPFAPAAAQSTGMVQTAKTVKTDDNLWCLVKGSLGILGSGLLLIVFTRNAFSWKKKDSDETNSSI